jgi:hypothetical protein
MSNKEIAQTLFVTIKTVEVHLSHACRKLDISSRAAPKRPLDSSTELGVCLGLIARPNYRGRERTLGARLGSPPMRISASRRRVAPAIHRSNYHATEPAATAHSTANRLGDGSAVADPHHDDNNATGPQ